MPERNNMLFCPINMACEVLQPRWTIHILTELRWGSTRFNDIRRGIPGISPTLLAKRLKTLQSQGLVQRVEDQSSGTIDYLRTSAAAELDPIISELGKWAYRNTSVQDQTSKVEPSAFVWNLRLSIDVDVLPNRRIVMKLDFPDRPADQREFWIMCRPGFDVDVCFLEPGFEVDLYIISEFDALVSAYFGYSTLAHEMEHERIKLIGDAALTKTISQWLILSSYATAKQPKSPEAAVRPVE
ncbi:MAG: helix-turn-helix transcriptional regulator [Alphaproteobacteria bacterium]|nr:helix-turn-helix transcriptional regulator [Alphaproteobacteria bacterium]